MTDAIRLPTRDIVANITTLADTGEIERYLFNDIGGTELINIVRSDSVSGISFNYTVISDLMESDHLFDPAFLLVNKSRYQSEFDRFAIKLATKIPELDYYDSNTLLPTINVGTNVYFAGTDLTIQLDNMADDEFVQIEIMTDGRIDSVRENDNK